MSNLLPKNEQNKIKTEYSLRRLVVLLSLVSGALLISLVLLFPSYLLSHVHETEASLRLEELKKAAKVENPSGDLTAGIMAAKDKVRSLQISQKSPSVYDLFRIFENKTSAIKLSEVSYTHSLRDGVESTMIIVRGKAETRDSLTAFSRALQNRPEFLSVDLPISNFAKDSNIDFTMNIVVKNK